MKTVCGHSPKLANGGFTLLELMVSATILFVVAAIVFGSFNSVVSTAEEARSGSQVLHMARFIIRRMSDDLASASLLPHNPNGFFIGEDSGHDGPRADSVRFSGFGRRFVVAGAGSDQAQIAWYVEKAPGSKLHTLMRAESPYIAGPESDVERKFALDVTHRLVSFDLKYLVGNEWQSGFDFTVVKALPRYVALEFTLMDERGNAITKTALLPIGSAS